MKKKKRDKYDLLAQKDILKGIIILLLLAIITFLLFQV